VRKFLSRSRPGTPIYLRRILRFLSHPITILLLWVTWLWFFPLGLYMSSYLGGLEGTLLFTVVGFFLFWVMLIVLCVSGCALCLGCWRKHGLFHIRTALALLFLGMLVLAGYKMPPFPDGDDMIQMGFHRRIKDKADVGTIRTWMKTRGNSGDDEIEELPDCIKVLEPNYGARIRDNVLILRYGGSFELQGWGVLIAATPTTPIPEDLLSGNENVRILQPGAYTFERLRYSLYEDKWE